LFQWNSGCSGILPEQLRKILGILSRGKQIEPNSRKSIPKHVSDTSMMSILFARAGFYVKLIFFIPFSSVPSLGIDSSVNLGMPWNEWIAEAIPSLFPGIFSEQNSVANPTPSSPCTVPPPPGFKSSLFLSSQRRDF
jgi:hypothetical protein